MQLGTTDCDILHQQNMDASPLPNSVPERVAIQGFIGLHSYPRLGETSGALCNLILLSNPWPSELFPIADSLKAS